MFQLLLRLLEKFGIHRKTKVEIPTLPSNTKYVVIRLVLWGIIGLTLSSMVWFLLRFSALSLTNNRLERKVTAVETQLSQMEQGNRQTDNLDVFGRYFIQAYYNTKLEPKSYKEEVGKYFPTNMELPTYTAGTEVKKVRSIQLWQKAWEETAYACTYLVNYQLADESIGQELIHFYVAEKDGQYTVISYPYLEKVTEITTKNNQKINDSLSEKEQVKKEVRSEVHQWLSETFFPRFLESENLDDISYMMNNPYLMGNKQIFKEIKELKVYPTETKQLTAKVTIQVSDRQTSVTSLQEYTVVLKEEETNKYFVESLTHTLGGQRNDE